MNKQSADGLIGRSLIDWGQGDQSPSSPGGKAYIAGGFVAFLSALSLIGIFASLEDMPLEEQKEVLPLTAFPLALLIFGVIVAAAGLKRMGKI